MVMWIFFLLQTTFLKLFKIDPKRYFIFSGHKIQIINFWCRYLEESRLSQ